MQNPAHKEERLHASIYTGDTQLKSSLVVKDLRVTADTSLNMSQQCVLETKRASGILGCSRRNVVFPGGCRKRLFPSAWYWVKPHLECRVQFCPILFPPIQELHGHTGKSLIKGHKIMKGLEDFCEEMLRELGLEKRRLRAILPMSVSTWRKGAKMDSGSGAQGQDRRQRAETGTQEVFRWHLLYCAGGWALAYVAHVTLTVSKTVWTRPWEAVLVSMLEKADRSFDLQWSFPISVILWFHDSSVSTKST